MYDFQLMICAIIYLLEKTSVASMTNSLEKKKGLEGKVRSLAPAGNHGGTCIVQKCTEQICAITLKFPQNIFQQSK